MKVTKRRGFEGDEEFEYTSVSHVLIPTGTPADKVQELIDVYREIDPGGNVPVDEVIENLEKLKRLIERLPNNT